MLIIDCDLSSFLSCTLIIQGGAGQGWGKESHEKAPWLLWMALLPQLGGQSGMWRGSPFSPGHIQAAGGAWPGSLLSQGLLEINCTVNSHVLNSLSTPTWVSWDRFSSHLSSCWLQGCVHHWRRICFAMGIFL